MHSRLVDGPRNESGGALGVFDGFWPLLRHDTCLVDLHSWASFVLLEGMNRMNTFSLVDECVTLPPGGVGRENIATIKKHYPTCFLPAFSLSWFKCYQSQFPRDTILQGSTTLSKQRLVCHPPVVGTHPVCTWAVFMQIRGFSTTPPPWLGVGANLASENTGCFCKKADCLSH